MNTYKAAGALFLAANTGHVFLQLRSNRVSNPRTFGFVGGMINPHESIMKGLAREVKEEIGFIPNYEKIYPLDVNYSDDKKFVYHTVLVIVGDEFIPQLNDESDGYAWVKIGNWPKPLHPGAKELLFNKNTKNNLIWAYEQHS